MKQLIVIGASSLGATVASVAKKIGSHEILGFFDDDERKLGMSVCEALVFGKVSALWSHPNLACCEVIIGIGNGNDRARIWEAAMRYSGRVVWGDLLASGALSIDCLVRGSANVLMPGAMLSYGVTLGVSVLVGANATVGTFSSIGDFATIGPGANIGSECEVGCRSFIGMGANVLQGVCIGANSIVGAGAVVVRDVAPGETVVGSPARNIKSND